MTVFSNGQGMGKWRALEAGAPQLRNKAQFQPRPQGQE